MNFVMISLAVLCLLMAGGLLVAQWMVQQANERRMVERRLDAVAGGGDADRLTRFTGRLGRAGVVRKLQLLDGEVATLLQQAGLGHGVARSVYGVTSTALPVVLGFVGLVYGASGNDMMKALGLMVFGAGLGYLVPKRLLAARAARRREALVRELMSFMQLVRILFDTGLTVEQALRVIHREGGKIIPELVHELDLLLSHVDNGLDLADELDRMMQRLKIDEVSDCFSVLCQIVRQGGSARSSLESLQKLFEDRRLTGMQEKVNKLSAKMSIVMMLLLFPALLIVLAGPGFISVIKAFGDMQ